MGLHRAPGEDRRIQKTKKLLHEALGELIREKPYDDIAVREILDRANVGRSTFYTHFRGKDELLVSVISELLESAQISGGHPSTGEPYERIVSFSLPVFEYISRHRGTGAAMRGARARAIVHERLQDIVARRIAGDVKTHVRGQQKAAGRIPPDLMVRYISATFVLVLNWWMESRDALPAKEVNELFRTMVTPMLEATLV